MVRGAVAACHITTTTCNPQTQGASALDARGSTTGSVYCSNYSRLSTGAPIATGIPRYRSFAKAARASCRFAGLEPFCGCPPARRTRSARSTASTLTLIRLDASRRVSASALMRHYQLDTSGLMRPHVLTLRARTARACSFIGHAPALSAAPSHTLQLSCHDMSAPACHRDLAVPYRTTRLHMYM
jgi:hypothetical protein